MKKAVKLQLSVFLFGSLLLACNNEGSQSAGTDSTTANTETASSVTIAEATIAATKPDTAVSGTARFTQEGSQVKLEINISVPPLANRSVAVHIHEHGDCGDAGNNTHGHWNPGAKQHGKWGEGDFHLGDIGNVTLDAEGKGTLTLNTDLWSIGGSDANKDILGKAIIVHSGVDDYKTQPTGGAGTRIGCGLIEKK